MRDCNEQVDDEGEEGIVGGKATDRRQLNSEANGASELNETDPLRRTLQQSTRLLDAATSSTGRGDNDGRGNRGGSADPTDQMNPTDPHVQFKEPPIRNSSQRTCAVDIFSMGCIFYHVLVPGGHPFGSHWFEREANVVHQRADLSGLR